MDSVSSCNISFGSMESKLPLAVLGVLKVVGWRFSGLALLSLSWASAIEAPMVSLGASGNGYKLWGSPSSSGCGVLRGFYVRVFELPGGGVMTSIVDEEVLGVRVYDSSRGVVIDVSREFYGGDLVGEEEVLRYLEGSDALILVGSRIVGIAVERGLVNPDAVLRVGGIEYVQIIRVLY